MTSRYLIPETFATTYQQLQLDPPRALLLHGTNGTPLHDIARTLAEPTALVYEPRTNKGEVSHSAGTIGVETIRGLYEDTRSINTTGRTALILGAHRMSVPAQNALLKLLEEPNTSTRFILTSHQPDVLLPTIRSRVQHFLVPPLSDSESRALVLSYKQLDEQAKRQILFAASGKYTDIVHLAEHPDALAETATFIKAAQLFVGGTTAERALAAHKYGASAASASQLIDASLLVLRHTLSQRPAPDIIARIDALAAAHQQISEHANPRLQLLSCVV